MPHIESDFDAAGHKYGIVVSRFAQEITGLLLKQTCKALTDHGVKEKDITVAHVPGAFELPLIAKKMAGSDKFDGVICIGAVIRGETSHFDYVCEAATSGILNAGLEAEIPVTFTVLTTENRAQAEHRADPKGKNVGYHYAKGTIEMVNLLKKVS